MNLILWLLIGAQAFAGTPTPLSFSARIQDEALAEEAIDLLHCLADRKGTSWELGLDEAPAPSVYMAERAGRLYGKYRAEKTQEFVLEKNGWRRICEQLEPTGAAPAGVNLAAGSEGQLSEALPEAPPATHHTPWLLLAAGSALAAGAFILWRAHQPDHRSIRME